MKLKRILALILVTGIMLVFCACGAQNSSKDRFPSKDITFVVPVAAGSGTDIIVREFANEFNIGVNCTVENIVGGAQATGIMDALSRNHDGYTIIAIPPAGLITNPIKNPEIGYSLKDLKVLAPLHPDTVAVICVRPDSKIQTLEDYVAYVSANENFNVGVPTIGGFGHMAIVAAMMQLDGVNMGVYTAYESNQGALQNLTNGEADFAILDDNVALTCVEQGQVRAIATIATARSAFLPDVVAITELYPDLKDIDAVGGFKHLCVAADTPDDVCEFLKAEIDKVLLSEQYNAYLETLNYAKFTSIPTVEEMTALAEGAVAVYTDALKATGSIE